MPGNRRVNKSKFKAKSNGNVDAFSETGECRYLAAAWAENRSSTWTAWPRASWSRCWSVAPPPAGPCRRRTRRNSVAAATDPAAHCDSAPSPACGPPGRGSQCWRRCWHFASAEESPGRPPLKWICPWTFQSRHGTRSATAKQHHFKINFKKIKIRRENNNVE